MAMSQRMVYLPKNHNSPLSNTPQNSPSNAPKNDDKIFLFFCQKIFKNALTAPPPLDYNVFRIPSAREFGRGQMSIMKKLIPLLFSVILTFPFLASCTLQFHVKDEFFSFFSYTIEYDNEVDNSSTNSSEDSSPKWDESEEDVSESTESSSKESITSEENPSIESTESSSQEQESSSTEEAPSLIEDGSDLATCAPFQSRAPEKYGVQNTTSIQSAVVSKNSTHALKGVFNNVGAYPYEGYKVWTWACLDLKGYFKHTVNLAGLVLTYDVKTENCGDISSFIVAAPNGQRTPELSFSFTDPAKTYKGISCVDLSNGWCRVTVDFTETFGDHLILNDAAEILIMFSNENCNNPDKNSVFYIDNMRLTDAPIVEDSSNNSEEIEDSSIPNDEEDIQPPEEDYIDFATMMTFRSQCPGYGAISTLTYDTEVVSEESTASLKGVFNNKGANVYQDYIVWTWAELCLEEDFEAAQNLSNTVLYYDVLTENCGIFSSFILVSLDGSRSKEATFAFDNPTQTLEGITSTPLTNGWYHVEIDFSAAYADNPSVLDDVSSILIMFSNQDCENRNADSVYYLDNMGFDYIYPDDEYPDDEDPEEDLESFYFPEELDLSSSTYVTSKAPETQGAVSTLTVQSEVTSTALFESTAALKGTFFANDTVKTWVEFQTADFYAQFDMTSIPLKNSILYFEVKTENCGVDSSIILVSPNGTYSREVGFALNDYEATNESFLCVDWGNGWTGVLVNVGTAFATEAETFESIATVIVTFTNKGYEVLEEDSVFYVDNFLLTALPDEEELEDFATNAPFVSRAPENYGVHNTLTVQSDVVFGNSTAALMGVFNNEGADVYNGYAVWTWAELCLEEFIGMAVPCNDLYLTFNAKVENGKPISSLILVAPDGTRSQEMTFDFNDPSKTYPGITCVALSDGWYQITIDFNRTFSRELYVLDEVSEMLFVFTNENCENPEENTVFYIDNMIFTDVNPNEEL